MDRARDPGRDALTIALGPVVLPARRRIVDATSGTGDLGAVLGVLLAAMILTELVTNAAAVALILPTGLAVAASASFLTPIGYQTNTMVWGPGRYHFTDYLRLGIPLWVIAWIGTALMVVR